MGAHQIHQQPAVAILVMVDAQGRDLAALVAARPHVLIVGPRGPDVDQPNASAAASIRRPSDRVDLPFGADGQVVKVGRIESSIPNSPRTS